ncbi:hypothetical protein MKZ38_005869 [Zalerion maritima]|uniref:Uncharacterized protein n=1 Tax=Zalerion maritima TaxID=339359 RepID=A0AAD5RKU8_9PEZI|nr:hypothetical protein MKZ38_005869 [Zalerion maritima]
MADYSMYHSLGQGEQFDPNDPNRTSQPAPPQFQQPGPGQPYPQPQQQQQQQQQQPGIRYGTPTPQQQQYYEPPSPMGGPQQQGHGYFGGGAGSVPPSQDAGLTAQMGSMSLGGEVAQHGKKKKKDRHVFHTVEPQGSSQAFNGIPQHGAASSQFLNADLPGSSPGPQFIGGGAPVPGGQFPAQVNPTFTPGTSASPMEFAARPGDGLAPAFVPAGGQGRVDPDELPSVPLSRDAVQPHYLANVYPTFEHHVPPPASISFLAYDQSNASPKYARLTTNNIPNTSEGLNSTGLPLGLLLQPLAPLQPGELEIPVLDFGDQGPPRCHRCRAYINPFMLFRGGGNKYVCNLCTYPNDTPSEYFCATTPHGVRVDRDQRPELCRGTVEFVVPKEYWTKPPVGIRWLFVIDVTQEASNKGFLEAFCEGILSALYGSDDSEDVDENGEEKRTIPSGAKVGFVTFDKDIHFYNVNPALEQAQMMIMPDIEDPFVPLHDGLFVDLYEAKSVITSLLSRLPSMFASVKNPEPAVLSTLSSALAALEETGGKVICSLSALSTWGPGRLFLRDDGKHPGGEMDKKLYTTDHPNWRKIAERMVSAGVGVDFFLAAPSGGFLDIATIGHVSATTGGETFYYPNFVGGRDNAKLSQEIRHAVTRETGFQALMKVRCSNGLQISNYHGNFIHHNFGADLEFGVIDADKAIGVTFSYDGKLDAKLDAHFQAALLYTTASGQRRVRCINSIASVTDNPKESMKFVDQESVVAMIAKESASKLATTSSTLKDIRQGITEKDVDVLACYRKNFSSQSHPPGQLVMPEKLKEFSIYMLCLLKCRAFKGGLETADRRVHEMRMILEMGALELSLYLYPRIIPVHNLDPEEGFPDAETGHLKLPPSMRATFSRVEAGTVYLVDNGQQCLLWMHNQTSPNLISDLFGEDKTSLQSLDPYMSSLPVLQTHLNAQVRNILSFLQTVRGSKALTLQLARQGIDGAEFEFASRLVEDRNNEAQSYVDWLVHLHKLVQLEVS